MLAGFSVRNPDILCDFSGGPGLERFSLAYSAPFSGSGHPFRDPLLETVSDNFRTTSGHALRYTLQSARYSMDFPGWALNGYSAGF